MYIITKYALSDGPLSAIAVCLANKNSYSGVPLGFGNGIVEHSTQYRSFQRRWGGRVSFSSFWKWVVLTPSSEKMGNDIPYVNKKWVACSDTKTVHNNHETH